MKLTFLGATGTVTGSRYLVETDSGKVLVDCGLFQGLKELRLRNWEPFPVDPEELDAIVVTHAHLDHSGYLPVLVKRGYKGPIYATDATRELCGILLPDSGYLQEEEATYANKEGFSKHRPALPLYTQRDAEAALRLFRPLPFDEELELPGGLQLRFGRAGHLLGAAFATLRTRDLRVVFSGDVGRPDDPLILPPDRIDAADYLVLESTYGDRRHDPRDPMDELEAVVNRTVRRGGCIIVPAFAVGRTQLLLLYIHRLKTAGRIPNVPVFLNSPMAIDASELLLEHADELRLDPGECHEMFENVRYVRSVDDSKALNRRQGPMIIVSASGMATGGRVLHHLKAFAPDSRNTILFAGFQAAGTRGASMVGGAATVKMHGIQVPINAEVVNLVNVSGHADHVEMVEWLRGVKQAPRRTFIIHGEPSAAQGMKQHIEEALGWDCHLPTYRESIELR